MREYPTEVAREVSLRRPDLAQGDDIAAVLMSDPALTADAVIEILDEAAADFMVDALANIAEVVEHDGHWYIRNYAPDSSGYRGGTEPGGDWDEECDRRLKEIRDALPAGWSADWSDDDIRIERDR